MIVFSSTAVIFKPLDRCEMFFVNSAAVLVLHGTVTCMIPSNWQRRTERTRYSVVDLIRRDHRRLGLERDPRELRLNSTGGSICARVIRLNFESVTSDPMCQFREKCSYSLFV